jgi:hypothetical protein
MSKHAKAAAKLAQLMARGFPIPPALADIDKPRPLALSTREDVDAFVALHGGGPEEAKLLGKAVMELTQTARYKKALAAEGSERITLMGEPAGPVADEARRHAAQELREMAERAAMATPKPPPPQIPQPPPPPPSAPPVAAPGLPMSSANPTTKPASNPFRDGRPISAAEVERRRQALASLRRTSA